MKNNMTLRQQKFANEYLGTGNATEAASRAYKPKNRNTAHSIGAENLRKPAIRAYLDEKAEDAASMVYKLSQEAKNENVRLHASRDILDRAGFKPPEKLNINSDPSLTFLEAIRMARKIREKNHQK